MASANRQHTIWNTKNELDSRTCLYFLQVHFDVLPSPLVNASSDVCLHGLLFAFLRNSHRGEFAVNPKSQFWEFMALSIWSFRYKFVFVGVGLAVDHMEY